MNCMKSNPRKLPATRDSYPRPATRDPRPATRDPRPATISHSRVRGHFRIIFAAFKYFCVLSISS